LHYFRRITGIILLITIAEGVGPSHLVEGAPFRLKEPSETTGFSTSKAGDLRSVVSPTAKSALIPFSLPQAGVTGKTKWEQVDRGEVEGMGAGGRVPDRWDLWRVARRVFQADFSTLLRLSVESLLASVRGAGTEDPARPLGGSSWPLKSSSAASPRPLQKPQDRSERGRSTNQLIVKYRWRAPLLVARRVRIRCFAWVSTPVCG